jgi:hypothetical protein
VVGVQGIEVRFKILTSTDWYRSNRYARRSGIRVLAVVLLWALGGCSFDHQQFRLGDKAHSSDPELHFVEADDYGWLWEPRQALDALEAVRSSGKSDTLVVVFVAGWHHLTKCCDDNVEGFREVLRKLQTELGQPMYAQARRFIHPGSTEPVRVMGIFVGWRGRSLPGWLDYATFWGRKAAATRVGEGDVREFLIDLRSLYVLHQKGLEGSADRRLLGLVSIGHSFGGQVLLQATSSFIEQELMQQGAPPAYLRVPVAVGSGPQLPMPVSGFGDLVILINPAVEAAAYQRLHALGMSLRYDAAQTPILLTISAANDFARKDLFPLGRIAGEVFTGKPHIADVRERGMQRQALGFSDEQVTHSLKPVDRDSKLHGTTRTAPADPACGGRDHCDLTWFDWTEGLVRHPQQDTLSAGECNPEVMRSVLTHDFSARTVFSNVVLAPEKGNIPDQALIVAQADPNVLDNHNGMFSEPLLQFLTRYIGFVEARKFLPLVAASGGCAGNGRIG